MKTNEIGLTLLIGLGFIAFAYAVQDREPETIYLEPVTVPINEVCADIVLRNPGGLSAITGQVCYNQEYGWDELNTKHLTESDWTKIVKPVKDSLRTVSKRKGIYDSIHDTIWRIK